LVERPADLQPEFRQVHEKIIGSTSRFGLAQIGLREAPVGSGLASTCRHAQSVAVGIFERALAPGEAFFVDGDAELFRDRVDVADIQVDQGVGPGVAFVF
jgi:hypothetical protein